MQKSLVCAVNRHPGALLTSPARNKCIWPNKVSAKPKSQTAIDLCSSSSAWSFLVSAPRSFGPKKQYHGPH